MLQEYFSALIQLIAGFGFAGLIIILSIVFGRRSKMRSAMDVPYECGNIPEGDGSPSFFSIKFYLVAILFLVFDLEVIFLYPWALGFQDVVMNNGDAFAAMTAFIGVLMVAYLYAVGKGAITWHRNPSPRR
ncbi:MAG: NADH-quinone oxidoreductase subunit A [Akkermansia sp.]|nr:NADH-quinone oxidoreductase subunit A [Akkermansia sp.]MBR6576392.1 NADH-quinone oxidoreductase subunit A [Akkermansia sp.]